MWRYGSEHHLKKHMKTTSLKFTTVGCFSARLAKKVDAKRPFIKTNNYRTANRLGKQQRTAILWLLLSKLVTALFFQSILS